jgi:hypothetical protein
MGLFLLLLWCSAVIGDLLGDNSRFGVFNSRLPGANSRLAPFRELAVKALIYLTVFAAKTAVIGENRKNSRYSREKPGIWPATLDPGDARSDDRHMRRGNHRIAAARHRSGS